MAGGPDFSGVTSRAHAETLAQRGVLEAVFLLPSRFGGQDIAHNVVFAPVGTAAIRRGIDDGIVGSLVAEGRVTRYVATPSYDGDSFVPVSITIVASDPGSFTTTIYLWGPKSSVNFEEPRPLE